MSTGDTPDVSASARNSLSVRFFLEMCRASVARLIPAASAIFCLDICEANAALLALLTATFASLL